METVLWLVPQALALLVALARLWARAARDRRRQQTVQVFASGLTRGGATLEIDDVRQDGSRLRVWLVTPSTTTESERQ